MWESDLPFVSFVGSVVFFVNPLIVQSRGSQRTQRAHKGHKGLNSLLMYLRCKVKFDRRVIGSFGVQEPFALS